MRTEDLPLVLAGPILRRLEARRVVLWLATSAAVRARLTLDTGDGEAQVHELQPGSNTCHQLAAGEHLHIILIDLPLEQDLPALRWVGYTLALAPLHGDDSDWQDSRNWAPDLCYPGQSTPSFVYQPRIAALLHGSCRKPHHADGDGLVVADQLLMERVKGLRKTALTSPGATDSDDTAWPAVLLFTGDQIYADDVAGPMLRAIHRLIDRLGIPVELLRGIESAGVTNASDLYHHPDTYYRREKLLPNQKRQRALIEVLFGGVEKPVFTTDSAHNHLVTLAEVLSMYLLVWSPAPWQGLDLSTPAGLDEEQRALYEEERQIIEGFASGLPAVRRVMAHLPVAMIFDDHDVTDDWNLSREWEEIAYGHVFSKRVIGNALLGYLMAQGWGNQPEAFDRDLMGQIQQSLSEPGEATFDLCIDRLLRFGQWHYAWPTSPPLMVLDTRTHRWRSESRAHQPSGLMDWEALTDLQQALRGHEAVLLVSGAPLFGVKLIEAIQRVFTWFGHPLMVDAENWMAHRGAAHAMLNIFRHRETPKNFVVLSGDVHYSFVYDVELRGRTQGPTIWQITSSGMRNAFPERLLDRLDRLNRWLYSPRSPLNWFTRRRRMRITPRKPEGTASGRRLLNGSGIGLVEIDEQGMPWRICELLANGEVRAFTRREQETAEL
ncbi:MAG: hypothetical protein C0453_07830 [Comamonadaceae bacterium]|nr:hypothetical protein [Comamonadaceae bacterium]